ncbi:hypothetical protein A9Q78_07300 [Methylophaga sp. 41_12_T18]|nr:hypothetical protein A9Q78_07300 [Methylophaga sp. 41_12_T18]
MKKRNVLAILVAGTLANLTFNLQAAEKSAAYKQGKKIYKSQCAACHQKKGQGIPGVFPPLAGSDYLLADKERAIKVPSQEKSLLTAKTIIQACLHLVI